MPETRVEPQLAEASLSGEAAIRDRAVERSLRTARAKAVSRNQRYIQTAIAILAETGDTDFTLHELAERSGTSLRTFYQHFSSKDELFLALLEEVMEEAVAQWRKKAGELEPLAALRLVVDKVHGRSLNADYKGINGALSSFNIHLAEARPADYGQVLLPLYDLLLDIVTRCIDAKVIRADIEPRELSSVLTQTLVGASQLNALVPGRPAPSPDVFWKLLLSGVGGTAAALRDGSGLEDHRD